MNQYLKIDELPEDLCFISHSLPRLLAVYLFYVWLTVFAFYSTFFLAVTIPFLPRHSPVIYITGFLVTTRYFMILFHLLRYHIRYGRGFIRLTKESIIFEGSHEKERLSIEDIVYCELRTDGLFIFHAGKHTMAFPYLFLQENARIHFLAFFSDIAPRRSAIFHRFKEVFEAATLAMVLAVHIIWYLAQNYYIPTGSMKNTLVEGDHIFGEKLSMGIRLPRMIGMSGEMLIPTLLNREVRRGDVVVFKPPEQYDGREFIKRIIALPGELFHIEEGRVYINGHLLNEPYVVGDTVYHGDDIAQIEGVVPDGMLIMLGDNRQDSRDSRVFGYVPVKNVRSRAVLLYFNSKDFKKLDFSRFGFIW
jgi:signal peptidase I